MNKICTQCARVYEDQPWRGACDRCGDIVLPLDDERTLNARDRAYLMGWDATGETRDRARARKRQAKRYN